MSGKRGVEGWTGSAPLSACVYISEVWLYTPHLCVVHMYGVLSAPLSERQASRDAGLRPAIPLSSLYPPCQSPPVGALSFAAVLREEWIEAFWIGRLVCSATASAVVVVCP